MVHVVTTHLQQLSPEELVPASRPLPEGYRFERVEDITPEFSRFLYRSVGSTWNWADRLPLSRDAWAALVGADGVETWVLYGGGAPVGYAELAGRPVRAAGQEAGTAAAAARAAGKDGATEVEIVYFGLFPGNHGRGLGGAMLTETLRRAWELGSRWAGFGPVSRLWVHTCSLDGPAALANYRARGMAEFHTEQEELEPQDAAAGLWPEPTEGRGPAPEEGRGLAPTEGTVRRIEPAAPASF